MEDMITKNTYSMNVCMLIQSTKTTMWEHVDCIQFHQNWSKPTQQQINLFDLDLHGQADIGVVPQNIMLH